MPASRQSGEIRIRLDRDGELVIPLTFRDALDIKAGDEIVMSWKDDELCITKRFRCNDAPRERDRR